MSLKTMPEFTLAKFHEICLRFADLHQSDDQVLADFYSETSKFIENENGDLPKMVVCMILHHARSIMAQVTDSAETQLIDAVEIDAITRKYLIEPDARPCLS